MSEVHVAIVGVGPRGLTALQAITRRARQCIANESVVIHLIDPNQPGEGCHSSEQPDHLLTNTLASQVTMFPLRDPKSPAGGNTGPSFTEWARAARYRRHGDRFLPDRDTPGKPIDDTDYLPRRMLGKYLGWVYGKILGEAPASVHCLAHRQRAVDMIRMHDESWVVRLDDHSQIAADFIILATGHCCSVSDDHDRRCESFVRDNTARNWRLKYFKTPYPIDRLNRINPDCVVAIQGIGLTAHDVISQLTVGRAGEFVQTDHGLTYLPSGREPRLLLISRHGLPAAARGINQKGIAGRHKTRFFTPEAIGRLRERKWCETGNPQLDFQADVLPLIKQEMCWAWRLSCAGPADVEGEFVPSPQERRAIEDALAPLRHHEFADFAAFRHYIVQHLSGDLDQAKQGNLRSAVKAATEIIRDARDALCSAVEYRGLTPQSHRLFVEEFVPLMNRIAFGPPPRRNEELLALLRAGILDWGGGPGAHITCDSAVGRFIIETEFASETFRVAADVLIKARLDTFSPETDGSALTQNLRRRGLIRPHLNGDYHPGGLDIGRDFHPVARDGRPLRSLWALGYPTEGVNFYTHALPRPSRQSQQIDDAETCAHALFDRIRRPEGMTGNNTPSAGGRAA